MFRLACGMHVCLWLELGGEGTDELGDSNDKGCGAGRVRHTSTNLFCANRNPFGKEVQLARCGDDVASGLQSVPVRILQELVRQQANGSLDSGWQLERPLGLGLEDQ
jgi:hypothetical protein